MSFRNLDPNFVLWSIRNDPDFCAIELKELHDLAKLKCEDWQKNGLPIPCEINELLFFLKMWLKEHLSGFVKTNKGILNLGAMEGIPGEIKIIKGKKCLPKGNG